VQAPSRWLTGLMIVAIAVVVGGGERGVGAAPPDDDAPAPRIFAGVRGTIVDASTGEPIPDVVVDVVDSDESTVTDDAGRFELRLAPGTYTLRVAGELYQRHRIRGVVVRHGVTTVAVKLSNEAIEEVIVMAPPDTGSDAVQVVRRRKRATVSDAISAEQIQRSPDSNASDAAKRMVGATIQDGKYVVVRGLGGRYSLTLLNGVPLPSPDPDVPAAPLDLFPAALLANLTVTKTFSPDSPANFAGGALSIETRSFPAKFTLKVKSGIAYDSQSSFRDVNGYHGGDLDGLGYDDGTRELPSVIPDTTLAGDPSLSQEELNEQIGSFSGIWELDPMNTGPNASLAVTVGDTLKIEKQQLGYFASASYGHGYNHRVTHIARVGEPDGDGGFLPSVLQLDDDAGVKVANLGGLVTAGWMPSPAHVVNLIGLYTHTADITGSRITGTDNSTAVIDRSRIRFVEREMEFLQLVGEDGLAHGKAILGWQVNIAHVAQHEPDTRDLLRTQIGDGTWAIDTGSGSAERLFSELGDNSGGGGADLTFPFETFKIKLGGSFLHSERDYQARRFHFLLDGDAIYLPPDEAFDPAGAGTSMSFYEATAPTDGYTATRNISAAYLMADVAHWDPLRIVAGARFERSALDVGLESKIDLMIPPEEPTTRTDTDVLPAINAVYALTSSTNLRAAYGMTVARPNFRETAPALYFDYVRRRAIGGNPNLLETRIHNADLRWETFLGDTELLAASLFYKKFLDPIEQTVEDSGDGSNVGFANAAGAKTYGLELEARLGLARLAEPLAPFSVSANLALIGSEIDLTGASRPLQGQSPYVANIDLGYEAINFGTQVDLLFNSFGRRIEEVGTGGAGNVYEEPFHRLDLTISQKLPRKLKLKLAGTNLLGQRVVRTQDGVEILAYQVGTTFVGSLEMSVD
jgi:outer membrane receptor protein involved in Fe transport